MSPEEAKEQIQKHVSFDFGKFLDEVKPKPNSDAHKLMIVGAALLITLLLFNLGAQVVLHIIRGVYQYHSKPRIELVQPGGAQ